MTPFFSARRPRAGLPFALAALALLAACADPAGTPPASPGIDATAPPEKPDLPRVDQAALRRDRAEDARAANARASAAAASPASTNMRQYLAGIE